ncbi:MAG: two component, sigma54 specific, transcriptional regulator, Fis family [Deltaproteobacteria bacterium]|nr:two component, sigma54 specific, transcriptional regulator, Fis family [Deltaproteobacteria bacterium]MBP1718031.1 two component, sigma54 specific, transcriptional regulator, Fis family [Deltaproteobacteria bacterium]
MQGIKSIIDEISLTDITVLIKGESGTGKDLAAQAIHQTSMRRDKPFIKVNCATIPKTLLESELFGFEKGAFTGADMKKPGKFDLANGGTILLNDIGEMDISIQAKLLQVLQDGEFSRLGGGENIQVNTRIITTTQNHLEKSMMEGKFRQDLFFRINVMSITVPPLRERKEQILPLSQYFFDTYKKRYEKPGPFLSSRAIRLFKDYDWPGNIRELENMIKRAILFGEEEMVKALLGGGGNDREKAASPGSLNQPNRKGQEIADLRQIGKRAAEMAEKEVIARTLNETHWNRKEAAKLLKVSYKALLYKIQKYRLDDIETSV